MTESNFERPSGAWLRRAASAALILSAFGAAFGASREAFAAPEPPSLVTWDFNYVRFPYKFRIMEAPPQMQLDSSVNFVYGPGEAVPFVKEIPQPFALGPDKRRRVAIVLRNDGEKPIYFYANFHTYAPADQSYGFKITCLCNHHVYQVKPHTTWSRLLSIKTYASFKRKNFRIRHDVIGMTEKEFNERQLLPHVDDSNEKD